MADDKITNDAKNYRVGLLKGFGMSDTPGAGNRAMQLYEDGMRKYLADPVAPIKRRLESFLKQLHKPKNWDASEYQVAKDLCQELERSLQLAINYRSLLLQMAEHHGIKLKKGIVI